MFPQVSADSGLTELMLPQVSADSGLTELILTGWNKGRLEREQAGTRHLERGSHWNETERDIGTREDMERGLRNEDSSLGNLERDSLERDQDCESLFQPERERSIRERGLRGTRSGLRVLVPTGTRAHYPRTRIRWTAD